MPSKPIFGRTLKRNSFFSRLTAPVVAFALAGLAGIAGVVATAAPASATYLVEASNAGGITPTANSVTEPPQVRVFRS